VFGGVERIVDDVEDSGFGGKARLGNMFSVVVEKRDARTLIPIIRKFIKPGTKIISDGWAAYKRIEDVHISHFKCYTHESVNHSQHFKDPISGAHTNTMEGAWFSQYKRHIPNAAYNKRALQGHLWERVWKNKYKHCLWEHIWRVLREIRYDNIASHPNKTL